MYQRNDLTGETTIRSKATNEIVFQNIVESHEQFTEIRDAIRKAEYAIAKTMAKASADSMKSVAEIYKP